jgi:hypothetical protein
MGKEVTSSHSQQNSLQQKSCNNFASPQIGREESKQAKPRKENCSPRAHRHRASACSVNFLSLLTLNASEGANTSTLTLGKRRIVPIRECTKKIRTTWQSLNALPTTISFINKQTDSLNYVVDSVDKILISQLEPLPPSPGFSFYIYMTHPYGWNICLPWTR